LVHSFEVMDTQEHSDTTGELPAHAAHLLLAVGTA
jgi:hypothetical protein